MRKNPLFMRNSFITVGKWGIPLLFKQELFTDDIKLVACSDTRMNDHIENKKKGVHFFVDDYRFWGIYDHPDRSFVDMLNMHFYLHQIFLFMQIWIYGGNLKMLREIDGLVHIGRIED